MNKDKVIKDLRERNDKLQSQYYMAQSRCWYAEHKLIELKKKNKKAIDKINAMLNVFPGFRSGKTIISENLIEVLKILGDEFDEKTNN